jgi:carbohydrate-binding DOMON domain-containing protein
VNANAPGVDAGAALSALQAAAATWNDDCSSFSFNYGGATTTTPGGDLENTVVWTSLPISNVVVTDVYWYTSDPHTVVDSDVKFNIAMPWAVDGRAGAYDIQNAAVGGFGFALPLTPLYGAADQEKSIYAEIEQGEMKKRSLAQEDRDGIRYIYPSAACVSPTATGTRTRTPTVTQTSTATPTATRTGTATRTATVTRTLTRIPFTPTR